MQQFISAHIHTNRIRYKARRGDGGGGGDGDESILPRALQLHHDRYAWEHSVAVPLQLRYGLLMFRICKCTTIILCKNAYAMHGCILRNKRSAAPRPHDEWVRARSRKIVKCVWTQRTINTALNINKFTFKYLVATSHLWESKHTHTHARIRSSDLFKFETKK